MVAAIYVQLQCTTMCVIYTCISAGGVMIGGGGCHSFLGACSLKLDASGFGSPFPLLPFQSLFT